MQIYLVNQLLLLLLRIALELGVDGCPIPHLLVIELDVSLAPLLDLVEDALRMIQKEILRHSSYNSLGAT
jgi:hypothetical protein